MTSSYARQFLAVLDPVATASMFAAETFEECAPLGLQGWAVYFCTRAAPMGAVPPEVVVATFNNFNPVMVRRETRWNPPSPAEVWEARVRSARRCMERVLGADPPGLVRAVEILRASSDAAPIGGRPLFAGHRAMPWPEDPLAAFWFGATLLREFRGDGHIAVLVSHGIDPIDALVLNAGWLEADIGKYLATREWAEPDWRPAVERLAARGFVDGGGAPTEGGLKFREMIEMDTDRAASAPFEHIGAAACDEAIGIIRPLAEMFIAVKAVPRLVGRTARTVRLGS